MDAVREYLARIGSKGGKQTSAAKKRASRENAKKALAARQAAVVENKHLTPPK